jgi:hypothetical protein
VGWLIGLGIAGVVLAAVAVGVWMWVSVQATNRDT